MTFGGYLIVKFSLLEVKNFRVLLRATGLMNIYPVKGLPEPGDKEILVLFGDKPAIVTCYGDGF